jgi:hypothetical protein
MEIDRKDGGIGFLIVKKNKANAFAILMLKRVVTLITEKCITGP